MITRRHGNLYPREDGGPAASAQLERDGYAVVENVLDAEAVAELAAEITAVYEASGPDRPQDELGEFRHGMFNRSPLSQAAIAAPALLEVIEPLLGEDCHVIANTAWRNVAGHQGGRWHIDAGPHIPRPEGVAWPEEIPYPIFAIGVHIFLKDCPLEAGPTAVAPGSHRSGRFPPVDPMVTPPLTLAYEGRETVFLTAKAGDAAFFVSDIWHRGTPAQPGYDRFFLQAHYGRRDIAQRIFTTDEVSHVTPEAAARASGVRERRLIGLHRPFFYDA
jgi:ectoine hydroxylase-related dioxygenase (phytanoyl-CoA dioxygenase family)